MKKDKKKEEERIYDEHGRWVQEKNRIKGAIRRVFRIFPQMKEVLNAARVELPPLNKKDGTPGKVKQVRFKCAICGELFSSKNVNIDHINPVVPLDKAEADMSYDELVRGICCATTNLQVVCSFPAKNEISSCHRIKSNQENWIRKEYRDIVSDKKPTLKEMASMYESFLIEKEQKKLSKKKRKKK